MSKEPKPAPKSGWKIYVGEEVGYGSTTVPGSWFVEEVHDAVSYRWNFASKEDADAVAEALVKRRRAEVRR